MILATLLGGLWQGAPIVAIGYLLSLVISKRNATTRAALWFATLAALVVIPVLVAASSAGARLLELFRSHPASAKYTLSLMPAGAVAAHAGAWFARAAALILVAWLVGVAINLARLVVSFVRVERIRRNARPLAGSDPDVFVSDDVAVPIVAGIVAPAIVIPAVLRSELTPPDLARIVDHERAHIRRGDPLLNLIQRAIEALLFFNPWVRIAGKRLSEEREAACDDWVVEKNGNADRYAACLAALAQARYVGKPPLLTPSAFRSRHSLVSRIERLGSSGARGLNVNRYAFGGIIVIFIVTTLVLQIFAPALALSADAQSSFASPPGAALAAACANPNVEAAVTNPARPVMPHGLHVSGKVEVAVTIDPTGQAVAAKFIHSSGYPAMDRAVVDAALKSTYSPKIVNCAPVQGAYLFRADFAPQ
ncbi:MAG: M56 family metallopeptidase [Candidatus Cybelea sp.]